MKKDKSDKKFTPNAAQTPKSNKTKVTPKVEKNKFKKHQPTNSSPNGVSEVELKTAVEQFFDLNPRKSHSLKNIFRALNIYDKEQRLEVVNILEALLVAGNLKIDIEGNFRSNRNLKTIIGTVDFVNPRYAFIISDELTTDVWVNADDLLTALDGDKVKVLLSSKNKGRRQEGEVVEVLERKRTQFVGKIDISKRFAFVIPDSRKMFFDIFIPKEKIKGANHGEKVLAEITEWHTATSNPVGKIVEVLGRAGENNTEMHAILSEYGLPFRFTEEVLADAEKIKGTITAAEIKKRRDFRNIITFTIDPDDAKDFDDALSIQALPNGNWEVGVHIADVTHYIQPESPLDKEAQKRATSVYLVDRVVPMLPERLSNFLCSLRPHEDKLTFAAVFELTDEAIVVNEWFGKTIIHSDKRFSYEEAQKIIETGEGEYAMELLKINQLAKKMTEARFANGAMNFETTEVKFKLDKDASPIGIYLKERKDAHRLIEEFMLLANKKVAEFVYNKRKENQDVPMVYRIHENPIQDKLVNFATFARKFGYQIQTEGANLANSINKMIASIEGSPEQNALQSLAIRTMAKARYTTEPMPHFGLAFEHYTHFTSPIRRYPDMMVHWLLAKYLQKRPKLDDKTEYEAKCKQATDMERRASDAERASIKYKQVEYMQKIGDPNKVYEGVVTGITEWGIYVELLETRCEGMVRLSDMADSYEYDAEKYRLVSSNGKKVITFGDKMKVRIKSTNLEKRNLDFFPEGSY